MKSIMNRMLAVLMVGTLMSVVALAKVHKHKVTFADDIKVNDTIVKKGTYDVKFDDETGQLSIVKRGKVVAQATAKIEQRAKKANDFQLRSVVNAQDTQLVSVTFSGSDKDIVITGGAAPASGSSN